MHRRRRGTALLTAVILSMVVMGLMASLFSLISVETQAQSSRGDSVKAFAACEGALNEALVRLRTDAAARAAGAFTLRGSSGGLPWAVRGIQVRPGVWTLTCIARSGDVYRALRAMVASETDLDALFGDAALAIAGDITKKGKIALHVKKPGDKGRRKDADGHDDDDSEDWTSASDSPVAIDGFDEAGGRDVPGLGIQDVTMLADVGSRLARDIDRGRIPEDAIVGAPTNLFRISGRSDPVEMSLARINRPRLTNPRLNEIADLIIQKLETSLIPRADARVSGKSAKISGVQVFGTPGAPKITVIDAEKVTLEPGAVVTGAGTLIIKGDLRILNRAALRFQGNIFVLGGDKGKDSVLRNQNGTLEVDGNVFVLGGDRAKGKASLAIHDDASDKDDSVTRVKGAVLALTGNNSDKEEKAEIRIQSGDVAIRGLLGAVGDKVRLDVKDHRDREGRESKFRLHGGAVVAVPETANEAHRVKVHIHGDNILFKYNSAEVRRALDSLNAVAGGFREALPIDFHVKGWIEVQPAACGVQLR